MLLTNTPDYFKHDFVGKVYHCKRALLPNVRRNWWGSEVTNERFDKRPATFLRTQAIALVLFVQCFARPPPRGRLSATRASLRHEGVSPPRGHHEVSYRLPLSPPLPEPLPPEPWLPEPSYCLGNQCTGAVGIQSPRWTLRAQGGALPRGENLACVRRPLLATSVLRPPRRMDSG
jgi:hypothetical protein